MSPNRNKQIVQTIIDAYNSNNFNTLMKVFAKYFHPEAFLRFLQSNRVDQNFSLSDMREEHNGLGKEFIINFDIMYMVAEEDKVILFGDKIIKKELKANGEFAKVTKYKTYNTYHFKNGQLWMLDRISDLLKRGEDLEEDYGTSYTDPLSYLGKLQEANMI